MSRQEAKSRRERVAAPRIGTTSDPREVGSFPTIGGDPLAELCERALTDDDIWDVFEPEVFGGPEAEPQPEYGDFCYETDDLEGGWG